MFGKLKSLVSTASSVASAGKNVASATSSSTSNTNQSSNIPSSNNNNNNNKFTANSSTIVTIKSSARTVVLKPADNTGLVYVTPEQFVVVSGAELVVDVQHKSRSLMTPWKKNKQQWSQSWIVTPNNLSNVIFKVCETFCAQDPQSGVIIFKELRFNTKPEDITSNLNKT